MQLPQWHSVGVLNVLTYLMLGEGHFTVHRNRGNMGIWKKGRKGRKTYINNVVTGHKNNDTQYF